MKRNKLLLSFAITFFICCIFFMKQRNNFSITPLENLWLRPTTLYENYYATHHYFPKSSKDVVKWLMNGKTDKANLIKDLNDIRFCSVDYIRYLVDTLEDQTYFFYKDQIDPLSKEKKVFLYYPLYDRVTKIRKSYILLSAGIDSVQNNINIKDTLFYDDWHKKLKVYNIIPYIITKDYNNINSFHISSSDTIIPYSNIDIIFGKKDFVYLIADIESDYTYLDSMNNIDNSHNVNNNK